MIFVAFANINAFHGRHVYYELCTATCYSAMVISRNRWISLKGVVMQDNGLMWVHHPLLRLSALHLLTKSNTTGPNGLKSERQRMQGLTLKQTSASGTDQFVSKM